MTTWWSWRWHLSTYHGHRQFWMFGLSEEQLFEAHRACYNWCHKPERDAVRMNGFISIDKIRESLGLNEPRG